MGREVLPRFACHEPDKEAAVSNNLRVLSDSGTSDPVAEVGRRASLDRRDWDNDKALSKDSLEMNLGVNSATGANRAETRDIPERRPVLELSRERTRAWGSVV